MGLKHDDFYARDWECEKPNFNAENNNATTPNSPEKLLQYDLSNEETWNTPEIAQECPRELLPQIEELCDVTDTYPDMEHDEERISGQPNISSNNPRSSKYNLRHNPQPNCNGDYRYYFVN